MTTAKKCGFVGAAVALLAGVCLLGSTLGVSAGGTVAAAAEEASPNEAYALFDRPASPEDAEASGWKNVPDSVDITSARVVGKSATSEIAAVKSRVGPCLVLRSQMYTGLNCPSDPRKGSVDPHATTASVGYGSALGVVPNSVKEVTFTLADGTSLTEKVVGNVWRAPRNAARATFVVRSRVQTVELMPEGSLPAGAKACSNGIITNEAASCTP